jgi:hypothetical protein
MFLTLGSPILEGEIQPVAHLVTNHATDTDPARIGERLQTGSDIHAIAEYVVLLSDHISQIDPDAELDPLLRRGARIALKHPALDLHSAAHGVNHAGELGKKAVAGVLHNPTAVLLNLRIDQLLEVRLEPLVRPVLIRAHQARVPRHIGG